ncbi:MAG TPA: hypothetical protein VHG53_04760 [Candidatus Limnocylindria bacterium]|nr:hypothetical protein [Candidatus Limnocylindria bacterium]
MKIGVDLDDVIAECAVPYLRAFAERFGLELAEEDLGWHTLAGIEAVSAEEKDRFRIALYDGPFFGELEPYADSPAVLERIVDAGHEIYFITARNERRRVVTETWLRDKGLLQHAKAVHLKPHWDMPDRQLPTGRYDATGSARYKVRLAKELALDAFCEDDVVIGTALAEAGTRVFLFDHTWNREVHHPNITRVTGWTQLARQLGV